MQTLPSEFDLKLVSQDKLETAVEFNVRRTLFLLSFNKLDEATRVKVFPLLVRTFESMRDLWTLMHRGDAEAKELHAAVDEYCETRDLLIKTDIQVATESGQQGSDLLKQDVLLDDLAEKFEHVLELHRKLV